MKSEKWTKIPNKFISRHHYALVCLVIFPFVVYFTLCVPWEKDLDFWELSATVRSIAANPIHPDNPIFNLPGNTSPRVIPYTLFLGVFMLLTKFNFIGTMLFAGIMNFLVFTTGLYKFIYYKFKSRTLPAVLLLTMLLLWGTGFHWANAYQLEVFFIHIHYVGFFVFSIGFYILYFLTRYLAEKQLKFLYGYIILSVIAFISHPITGIFIFLLAFVLCIEQRDLKKFFLLQLIPLSSFLLALVWPYFKYWNVFFAGTTTQWYHSPMFGTAAVYAIGPAILGFPIAYAYFSGKKYPFLTMGLMLSTFIYLVCSFLKIQIGERFFIFTVFLLQMNVAVFLDNHFRSTSFTPLKDIKQENLWVWLLLLLILYDTGIYRLEGLKKHFIRIKNARTFLGYQSPTHSFQFLKNIFAIHNVIMADLKDGWVIPALTGAKIVGSTRASNPLIMNELNQRKTDAKSFFNDNLSDQERNKILKKYHVTHILLNKEHSAEWDKTLESYCHKIEKEVINKNNMTIIKIDSMKID